jgi:phenylacetate-CoA ligase
MIKANQWKQPQADRLLVAALDEFYDVGYHGATVRSIAERAGVSLPTLYNHYPSKQSLLVRLCHSTMDDLYEASTKALRAAEGGPEAHFRALTTVHVDHHVHRQKDSFVATTELRSLSTAVRREIIFKRDRQQRLFDNVVLSGIGSGVFHVIEPLAASRAIVTMCTSVAQWYRPYGPLTPDQIAQLYVNYGLQMLGVGPQQLVIKRASRSRALDGRSVSHIRKNPQTGTAMHYAIHSAEVETMSRDELRHVQSERLMNQVRYLYANSKFYKRKFDALDLKPADISGIDDIGLLPLTTKDELRADQEANPPYGSNVCVDQREVVWLPTTSGTSGRPVVLPRNQADIATWTGLNVRAFTSIGMSDGDVFQHVITYHWIYGGLALFMGAQALGAAVINAGTGNTEKQLWSLQHMGVTALHATPTYLTHLGHELERRGLQDKVKLRVVFGGGEIGTAGEAAKKRLRELYPTAQTVADVGGVTDVGTMFWAECQAEAGAHLFEDSIVCELLEPDTLQPLPEGAVGELVVTDLVSKTAPLLRYRIRDLASVTSERCECGRTLARLTPGIIGRADDMLVIRGANVHPSAIDDVIKKMPELTGEYQIIVDRPHDLDRLTVKAEVAPVSGQSPESRGIAERLEASLKVAFGSRAEVELVRAGTLPHFTYKASRVVDKRRGDTEESLRIKADAQR